MSAGATTIQLSPADAIARVEPQMFFIVGCGRSGTTLLLSMLISDPSIVIPPETKFYGAFASREPRWGSPDDPANRERLIPIIYEDQTRKGVAMDRARFESLARAAGRGWAGLLLAVVTAHAETVGGDRVGEKSPVHTHFVGPLARDFPKARFVHVLRDPRAVVLSRIKAGFGSSLVGPNVDRWRRAARMHREHADRLGPSRYLLVKYEDLVTAQEPTLRRICEFLSIPFSDAMLQHHKRERKGFEDRSTDWMTNTLKPVFTSSVDKWKTDLKPAHIAMIEHALADDMRALGYEVSGASAPLAALRERASEAMWPLERRWMQAKRQIAKLRGQRIEFDPEK